MVTDLVLDSRFFKQQTALSTGLLSVNFLIVPIVLQQLKWVTTAVNRYKVRSVAFME